MDKDDEKLLANKKDLVEAVREGFIQALNSPEAVEAVEGAVTAWFDRQSGKAIRRVLNSLAVGALLLLATNFSSVKTWFTTFEK